MTNPFGETPLGLDSQVLNLAGVLSRPFILRIPPFQRPYTWTVKEVSQLLEDLRAAFERAATYYFIGQIVFVRAGRELDISDGQQRLTTLTMIIAAARDRSPEHAALYQTLVMAAGAVGRLRLKPGDAEFFAHYVQAPNRMRELAELAVFATDAQECMILAAREIESYLDEMDHARRDAFIRYIARCATFDVIDAAEPGGAATVYETMNYRGKALSGSDILKGALLNTGELTPNEVTEAARLWEHLEDRAGRDHFSRLLRYVPMFIRTGPIISPGDVAALTATIAQKVGVRRFLMEVLPRYCDAHRSIFRRTIDAGADSADVNRRVGCLNLFDLETWEPLAIAYLVAHGGERDKTKRFFLAFERFEAACLLGVIDSRTRRRRLDLAWRNINDDKALTGPGGAFDLTPHMRADLRGRLSRSSRRDKLRRYLVLRINAALGEVLGIYDDANVEHVLPNTPTNWWRHFFSDPDRYADYANMIGNYVLVTDKQDSDADNRTFPEKFDVYFNRGYPVRAITADIARVREWTIPALEERQERLCHVMSVEWELSPRA